MSGRAAVLGPVTLPGPDGEPAAVAGVLARRLVVALALAGPRGRSAAALADDVWGEDAPRNPRGALQMLVSRLRAGSADGVLQSTATGYRLAGSDLDEAEGANAADAAAALALWRGDPGADVDSIALSDPLAARAAAARARLLHEHATDRLAAGDAAAALVAADELAAIRPQRGGPVALRMRALAALGRQAEALAAFAAHREDLADRLGADPDPELVAVNAALLQAPAAGRTELVGVRTARDALLGRDADLVALDAALATARIVTVQGVGGLGKTRIAHEVAARQADRFARVVFVELAGTRTAADVALAVGEIVGARGVRPGRRAADLIVPDLAARTVEALAAATTLLVLDNCEQVVDAAAALADDLTAAVPDLVVLTTSRVPLLVPGEVVHLLPPLATDSDAALLFQRRARAARPGVQLDPAAVARVVGHLDGLPLAIELAAARLRTMTLDELESRLDDRFALLVGGSRTAPERHRTLFAVIDWSWRLLPADDQRAAARLGVLPDGFTPETAAALLGRDAEPLIALLVDQSLLTFVEQPSPRFRMLETVREFAVAAADRAGDAAAALQALDAAMVTFCRSVAPGLTGGATAGAFAAVTAEEETLRTLLRRDAAGREPAVLAVFALLAEYWIYRGEFETAAEAAPPIMAVAAKAPRAVDEAERVERVQALALLGILGMFTRGPGTLRVIALLGRELRSEPAGLPPIWAAIARAALARTLPEADSPVLIALADDDDPAVATLGALLRGQVLENVGRQREAIVECRRAERLAEHAGLEWFRVIAASSVAQLHSQLGERPAALRAAADAERHPFFGSTDGERSASDDFSQLEWLIGVNLIGIGDLDGARARLDGLLGTPGRGSGEQWRDNRAIALAGVAELESAEGSPRRADAWAEAVTAAGVASAPWTGLIRGAAAADAVRRGDRAEALRLYRRLRLLTLALIRLGGAGRLDHPVVASAALGLAAVLADDPATADCGAAVGSAALAAGARLDMPALEWAAERFERVDAGDPIARVDALLRSPTARLP